MQIDAKPFEDPYANTISWSRRAGFGAMPLSIQGRPDEAAGTRVLYASLDAGVTLIDTGMSPPAKGIRRAATFIYTRLGNC